VFVAPPCCAKISSFFSLVKYIPILFNDFYVCHTSFVRRVQN
jgi:hypothetical protein